MLNVTVIIPSYNHAPYLKQRIESVVRQTYKHFEVLILDDCSSDDSRTIIEQYRGHEKIRQIVYNEHNSGSTFKQWNKGVAMARGNLIWIAESDDVAATDFLETLVCAFVKNPSTVIAYCQSTRMNSAGEITGNWLDYTVDLEESEIFTGDFLMSGDKYIERYLVKRNTLPNASAVVFRKEIYEKVGGADPSIKYCSDWLTWLKILSEGMIYYHAGTKNSFRYHASSVISTAGNGKPFKMKYDIVMRRAYEQFLKQKGVKNSVRVLNRQSLTYEISFEIGYLRKRKKYLATVKYYLMRLFNK